MTSGMTRNLPGTFLARDLGKDSWLLVRTEPAPIDVLLSGVGVGAADAIAAEVSDIDIEWRAASVLVTLSSAGRRRRIEASGAIVHEPLTSLYATLPLAALDARAHRFWRRVFRLVRIPGGRYLLAALARRDRGAH
jgi:hypothetical protein